MTWWDWLILSILAWVAVDVVLVALFSWRRLELPTPRPNRNGPEGKPGAEVERRRSRFRGRPLLRLYIRR